MQSSSTFHNKNNNTSTNTNDVKSGKNVVPKRRVLGSKAVPASLQSNQALIMKPGGVQSNDSSSEISFSDSSSISGSSFELLSPTTLQEDMDLFCPICNEKMMTLSQLNRHLDDEHKSDEPVKQLDNDIRTWFKKKLISKANDVINDRKNLVKLDLFDNDRNFTFSTANDSGTTLNELTSKVKVTIPNGHWKKLVGNDICHHLSCNMYLNIKNGIVNCRKCGYLFCNEHTFYKIKINEKLEYDLDNGVLVRCCYDCFINKPGYRDTAYTRDLTSTFKSKRTAKNDERDLEVNRLERRLIKIYDYFQLVELNQKVMNFRKFETSIVNWENDGDQHSCFICDNKFSLTTMLRKHHCRLCGRVVCGDLETQCSMEVPIGVLMQYLVMNNVADSSKYPPLKKGAEKTIRCCKDCKKIMFDKKLFIKDLKSPKPEILRIYETILIYKTKIESLLPDFKDSLNVLNETKLPEPGSGTMNQLITDHEMIKSISKERVKLKELFKKLDLLMKRLYQKLNKDETEGTLSPDEIRLERSIYTAGVAFLQNNMSKLQEISSEQDTSQSSSKKVATVPKISKKEVRINREKLMVLKEQKFLVEEMIANCKKKRKFDDLKSLEMNLKDLEKEVADIDSRLGDEFGFE